MKTRVFTGVATAIITPLNENGIDYESFARLMEWQIEEGINAIVACGTTGEGSTLTDDEHKAAIRFVVKQVNGRVPVIAGTGSNDTSYSIQLTKDACESGVDAVLVVTPYYNKATQNGLIEVFTKIADTSTKPVILYNVPSRTGVNIEPKTCQILAEHPNIVGIKEASGNISQIAEIAQLCGDKLDIYSGNDDEIVPIMSLGGKGIISVLSNVLPKETVEICDKYFEGDIKGSCQLQLKYIPFIKSLFCEVNPIPVKAAVSAMGYCDDYIRLPLTNMESQNKEQMLALMTELEIELV